MWAQVVHGVNVSNIVNGGRVAPRVVADRFDFDLGYDAQAAGARLQLGRARQLARLGRLWAGHPGELTKWAEAKAWSARGTHERSQDDGSTFTDRVQDWETGAQDRIRRATQDARRAKWRLQRRVNEIAPQGLRRVAGDVDAVLGADRVVVLAEYRMKVGVRQNALDLAAAFAAAGWPTLVVAARDGWAPARIGSRAVPGGVAVVRRTNLGYDFGSWAAALAVYPRIGAKQHVLLTNDSLLGPVVPLGELLRRIEASTADVWAATDNRLPVEHLQSYLLAFRGGVLGRDPLAGFFAGVRPRDSKGEVVRSYEFGLTAAIDAGGLTRDVGWTKSELGITDEVDSSFAAWEPLLDAGFPFVKRALVDTPQWAGQRAAVRARLSSAGVPPENQ